MENWQNRHVRIQGDDPIVTFVSPSYFLGEKIRLRCECYNRINFFPPKPWYLYVTHTFQFFGPKNRKHDVKTERGIYLWKCPGRYFGNFILFSKIIWMMDRAAVVSLSCLRNGWFPGFLLFVTKVTHFTQRVQHTCTYMYMYVCMYVCMHMYMYAYVCICIRNLVYQPRTW